MTKYDALKEYLIKENTGFDDQFSVKNTIEAFEIAWEAGEFDEDPKGECCQ